VTTAPAPLRVALGEYDTGWHDPAGSLARAGAVVRAAAAAGAQLVVLPEMCSTGFTMDATQAEPLDGPSARGLAALARASTVHLLAGLAAREGEAAVNVAMLFDDAGQSRAVYRKQRVFAYAGEDAVYTPGSVPVVATIAGVRLAPFICYDLRFPELFRTVAREVDAMIVIANWPAARRSHWDTLVRARAVENQCCVVAVNCTGEGGGIHYDGGSVAYDPWGEPLIPDAAGCVSIDPARVRAVREEYPFLRDMRTSGAGRATT
jgi:omega-amidase